MRRFAIFLSVLSLIAGMGWGGAAAFAGEPVVAVSGENLSYLMVAVHAMKTNPDIPEEKRQVENYSFSLKFSGDDWAIVHLHAHATEEWRALEELSSETDLGREVEYTIDRKTLKVLRRQYFK